MVSAALATAGIATAVWSAHRPPAEVRTLEAVLRRLSHGNNLGDQPLQFMVASGTYTAQLAAQRGLCKPDQCDVFAQLNPYQRYSNGWDELIRQGYALGDIQAWSASSGTVVIPRAAFRAYGPRLDYLSCTVAHEIAHIQRHHVFQHSYYDSHALRQLQGQHKEQQSLAKGRDYELEADRDAADMMARAGYRGRVCLDDLVFMHKSVGDGSSTEPDSTHPGYEERIAAMKAHYEQRERRPLKPQKATPGSVVYNRDDNLLTFVPL
jgi:hypothetical protein